MSYTQIFGGQTISPSFQSYSLISLTALNSPYIMLWPLQFQNSPITNNVVSQIINLEATQGGLVLQLPDATLVSVGTAILFVNVSAYTVTVNASDGATQIVQPTAGQAIYVYLTDNTTTNGTWQAIPFGAGATTVTSVAATSLSPDLIITGSPITNNGTFVFSFGQDLSSLISFGAGTGIAARTAANTWALRTLTGTGNQITIANGTGVAGNPTFSLAPAISGITSLVASNIQLGIGSTNTISTVDNNPILMPQSLAIQPNAGVASSVQFYDALNAHYVAFKGGADIPANVTWTLPTADGAAGTALTTNGAGVLSWAAGGGAVNSVTGTTGEILAAPTTGAVVLTLAATAVTPGSYTNTNLTVDAFGRITTANNGAASASGATIVNTIAQANAFTLGQVVYLNGSTYTLAKADNVATAEGVGIVTATGNPFQLTTGGYIPTTAGITMLTAGGVYYLSDVTAGLLTLTEPTTAGHVQKPMFVAETTTSGYVINYRGKIIPATSGQVFWVNAASTPITMALNTGYSINNGATQVVLNMPTTVPYGTIFAIAGFSSGGWLLNMAAGQVLHAGTSHTNNAGAGSVTFNNQYDSMMFVCVVANTTFVAWNSIVGTPTFA